MKDILTIEEVRNILNLDEDYSISELEDLAHASTSFIFQKTGYKYEIEPLEPLAKQLARIYVRTIFYGKNGTDLEGSLDYTVGFISLITDLQNIVSESQRWTIKRLLRAEK